jgi:hypothetical protein
LSDRHCINAESLLDLVDCFHLGIPKFLTKLETVSQLQANKEAIQQTNEHQVARRGR